MKTYLENFFEEFDYPADARVTLGNAYDVINESAECAEIFDAILKKYDDERRIDVKDMIPGLTRVSELTGIHDYTVKLLIHILLSKTLRAYYAEKGLDDSLWYGAMADLKWKLIESHLVRGVWGTFVADCNWFSRWYDITRFALCRLQFEITKLNRECEIDGVKLTKDSKVINIHIPRTGTPLNHDEVLRSYEMAKEMFKDEFKNEPMVFHCASWLLFPEHERILHERSNIRKFMSDFTIIADAFYPETNKSALWRAFDVPETTPTEELPEDSFLKVAYKKHLLGGGKLGYGIGVFLA